jgi:hypothetical protein
LQGATSVADACLRYGIEQAEFQEWRRCFLEAGIQALIAKRVEK